MKSKQIIIFIIQFIICNHLCAQKSVRDSLKDFTFSVVKDAIKKGKIKTLAVWDFTDIGKGNSISGSYISEQFSIYAEKVENIRIMDRQNLKSLLKEHKLKSEGFIDKNTIMELGKFKEVDGVAVGSVIIVGDEFQVNVKIIETTFGETVSAGEEFFAIDKRIGEIFKNQKIATDKIENNGTSINLNNSTKSSKCVKCDGLGTISVKGICSFCKGTGKKDCISCRGTGRSNTGDAYPCDYCNGKGFTTCSLCKGNKVVSSTEICPVCEGQGEIINGISATSSNPCSSNNGTLRILNTGSANLSIIVSTDKVDLLHNSINEYDITSVSSNSEEIVPGLKPGLYYVCSVRLDYDNVNNPIRESKKINIERCKEAKISF